MTLEEFKTQLLSADEGPDFRTFCQQHLMHGTPHVFAGREDEFFEFKKLICDQFDIALPDVFIVGSGKLGFSPHKETEFSFDSDVDVAIVSKALSEEIELLGAEFEYARRNAEFSLSSGQAKGYNSYLRYRSIGWTRPDLIPQLSRQMIAFKADWFDFFRSISNGRSTVGNYKVSAGLFKNLVHLEKYTEDSIKKIQQNLKLGA
jgi:hypothetical protein